MFLHQSGSSLGTIQMSEGSSVQLYANINTTVMSSHHPAQEGDQFCVPEDERALVKKVRINPRTKAKQLVKW